MLTSWFDNNKIGDTDNYKASDYINKDGVHVLKVKKTEKKFAGKNFSFNTYENVYETITAIKPDIIFIHGLYFSSLSDVLKYAKENKNVLIFADQHGDYYNSRDSFSDKLVSRFIYIPLIHRSQKYITKFWGTTPWRCRYLNEVLKVKKSKTDLLVMGADTKEIEFSEKDKLRNDIRSALNIGKNDFVICSGGKIDKSKNIHILMKAVNELNSERVKMILFGNIADDFKEEIEELCKSPKIKYVGWLDSKRVYRYFLASDLCFFPGTHSVLWEAAVGCGVPCVFNDWEGMHHVDLGGNCLFVDGSNQNEISDVISELVENRSKYEQMKNTAQAKGIEEFSYYSIAKKAILQK